MSLHDRYCACTPAVDKSTSDNSSFAQCAVIDIDNGAGDRRLSIQVVEEDQGTCVSYIEGLMNALLSLKESIIALET